MNAPKGVSKPSTDQLDVAVVGCHYGYFLVFPLTFYLSEIAAWLLFDGEFRGIVDFRHSAFLKNIFKMTLLPR
jgi:hypothetical protein